MTRNIIKLNLDTEDKSAKSLTDKELKKAFALIIERANDGLLDDEDINFFKARREYLTDEQLLKVTGKTFDELENDTPNEVPLSKLKKEELIVKAQELGIELEGDEKKEHLIALIEAEL